MIKALRFEADDAGAWDQLVHVAPAGTFLHSRQFLSYHGERFNDQSLIFADDSRRVCGVFPAAASLHEQSLVVSHPGATYGGLLFDARQSADRALELLQLACGELAQRGFQRLLYKSVPVHLHAAACQADVYALWKYGARLVRRDLWNVIDLRQPRSVGDTRRQGIRHAMSRGVMIAETRDHDAYASFWSMLSSQLSSRHGVSPVHSLDEMWTLAQSLPEEIRLNMARGADGRNLAGVWLFRFGKRAWHTQYIASSGEGKERALDLLLNSIIEQAQQAGVRYFSFGSSTEQEGSVLNSGLFNFKATFGAGSVTHDFYEIDLRSRMTKLAP